MKKLASITVCLFLTVVCIFSLAACGESEKPKEEPSEVATSIDESTSSDKSEKPKEEPSEVATSIDESTSSDKTVTREGIWENATYLEDTEFGSGKNTVAVEVKAGEQSVIFTVKTDKDTVGAALLEHKLIEGDEGQYGLYIKKVNGITADYDVDQHYWGFFINGEYATTGVDTTKITEGATYKLEYTK